MRSSILEELGAEMATTGVPKAAANVQTILLNCRCHGSRPWAKPEEHSAPSVLEKRLSNGIQKNYLSV